MTRISFEKKFSAEIRQLKRGKTMKNKFTKTAMATILGLLILIGGGQISAFGQGLGNRSIEGVWKNQVTVTDCRDNVLANFPGLLNYHQGGTMSETGGTNPALRSPGYGIWEFRGRRNYGGKFTFYTFAPDGSLVGRQEVNQNIVISRDSTQLNDTAFIDIFDANDNLLFSVCATAAATRF
jgi:hypothetical protein